MWPFRRRMTRRRAARLLAKYQTQAILDLQAEGIDPFQPGPRGPDGVRGPDAVHPPGES